MFDIALCQVFVTVHITQFLLRTNEANCNFKAARAHSSTKIKL